MRNLALAVVLGLAGGCVVRVAEPAPPPRPAPQVIIRAKEVHAGRIRAGVIYANEFKARDGQVGRVLEGEGREWESGGRSNDKIDVPELVADVIYAKEIKTDWVEASEIHGREVHVGHH